MVHFRRVKVLVQITKYPEKGKNAEGKIVEVLGSPNQAGVDMLSLIKEYKLPSTFPEQVVEEAKQYGDKIDKKDMKNRIDCRKQIIFRSIRKYITFFFLILQAHG